MLIITDMMTVLDQSNNSQGNLC